MSLLISFENTDGGLMTKDGDLKEFEIAGEDGIYVKAEAKIVNNEVQVSSAKVKNPVSQ